MPGNPDGKVVALLTVRNEELYLARTLLHLQRQGVETWLIDNGSTDRTAEIARSFLGRGVGRIEHLPFTGSFELAAVLENEERLGREADADWLMHCDADEIREAPPPYATLKEGFLAAREAGCNAVNFDEFVFLPAGPEESHEGTDFVRTMRRYYFYRPRPLNRINAWRKSGAPFDLVSSGGHQVSFEGRKIFPVNFVLRHYIFLSREHALRKYADRIYSPEEIRRRGWHRERSRFKARRLVFPAPRLLRTWEDGVAGDTGRPWTTHLFTRSTPFDRLARWWRGLR